MAFTLKASGIATQARCIFAVDSDNSTIKEFVSSSVNSGMTTTGVTVGTSSWKSTTRGYFTITSSAGIALGATKPTVDMGSGHVHSMFFCWAGKGSPTGASGYEAMFFNDTSFPLASVNSSNKLTCINGQSGTTSLATDNSTKFSAGFWKDWNVASPNGVNFFYGLESGSLAADGTGSDAGIGSDATPIGFVGFQSGLGSQPGKYHMAAIFSGKLSLSDFQDLHNDPWGTLFDAPIVLGGSALTTGAGTAGPGISIGL